jgi:hypothetical protein
VDIKQKSSREEEKKAREPAEIGYFSRPPRFLVGEFSNIMSALNGGFLQ